ncbi:phage terminase small subunit [Vibrio sp. TRT 1302]|uniref:phage terminase small subunit n=1 Tax=Vibrio sp. TRT 1302 TaxID=3418504 RepID=UPI003CF050F3
MVSPLKKQRDAILLRVKRNDATASGTASTEAGSYALLASKDSLHIKLVEFEQDKLVLKEFASIDKKVEHKRNVLIPKYKPMVEAYLEAGEAYQNPIFTDLIVWLFDAEDLDTAISWCIQAIEQGLPTPENLKCNWPTFAVRSVLEWSEAQARNGNSFEPYYGRINEQLLEDEWDVPNQLHAQWLKFAAYALLTDDDRKVKPSSIGNVEHLERALALMEQAEDKHNKIGVATKVKEVKSRLKAIQEGTNL